MNINILRISMRQEYRDVGYLGVSFWSFLFVNINPIFSFLFVTLVKVEII